MDVDAVDVDAVLRIGVERRFCRTPVVVIAPVVAEIAKVVDVGAVVPARALDLPRPAGAR
ncbi:unannotated protein [freshwater metagenome]|uniref:Unannotated protein n=1 Tax=freshwater metagenome TaxID=449393 RepID=A0A6J7I3H2_9ZZZZ